MSPRRDRPAARAIDPKLTIRVPTDILQHLRSLHTLTYSDHQASFNTWLVDLLAAAERRAEKKNRHLWASMARHAPKE